MLVLANFLIAVAGLLGAVLSIFFWVLVIRAVLSWVSPDPRNAIVQIIYGMTEPVLARGRKYIPPIGMFDLSFLVIILLVGFLQTFLVGLLMDYGAQLRAAGSASVGM